MHPNRREDDDGVVIHALRLEQVRDVLDALLAAQMLAACMPNANLVNSLHHAAEYRPILTVEDPRALCLLNVVHGHLQWRMHGLQNTQIDLRNPSDDAIGT